MILHISLAWFGQPSTETVKQLPNFQIDFGGKIKWWDQSNLKAMLYDFFVRKNWVKHGNFLAKINVWTENSHLDLRCVYKTVQICLISFGLAH